MSTSSSSTYLSKKRSRLVEVKGYAPSPEDGTPTLAQPTAAEAYGPERRDTPVFLGDRKEIGWHFDSIREIATVKEIWCAEVAAQRARYGLPVKS